MISGHGTPPIPVLSVPVGCRCSRWTSALVPVWSSWDVDAPTVSTLPAPRGFDTPEGLGTPWDSDTSMPSESWCSQNLGNPYDLGTPGSSYS